MAIWQIITEGKARARIPVPRNIVVSRELPIFYNPVMKQNRDITVAFITVLKRKNLQAIDLLAASGIRAIRLLKECPARTFRRMVVNDLSQTCVAGIKRNLALNHIRFSSKSTALVHVINMEARRALLESSGFDYIDVDPFGTPNPFLDAAVQRISRGGILAVTATDTSALCGSHPKACRRKYWADPKRCAQMHELGIRILIRKVQLIGAQYDKALIPLYAYSHEHYFRVFLKNEKGKSRVDQIIKQHGILDGAGPMWLGRLWDSVLAKAISGLLPENRMVQTIREESVINIPGFIDVHQCASKLKLHAIPKQQQIVDYLRAGGFTTAPTHFSSSGIRTSASEEEVRGILKAMEVSAQAGRRMPFSTGP